MVFRCYYYHKKINLANPPDAEREKLGGISYGSACRKCLTKHGLKTLADLLAKRGYWANDDNP